MNAPVIVGYDASPWSERALDEAAAEAAARNSALVIAHAYHWLLPATPESPPLLSSELSTREVAEETVKPLAAKIRHQYPGMTVETRLAVGSPPRLLADLSREAGVLFVGSRGHGGFVGLLLGSVSHRTLGKAACPVIVVRDERRRQADRMLVLVDLDAPNDDLLEFAFAEASLRGARLTALTAWDGTFLTAVAEPGDLPGEIAAVEAEYDDRLAAAIRPWQAKYPDVHANRRVGIGSVGTFGVKETEDVDLVVVGGRKRGSDHQGMLLGPVTETVLHHAACPVAVVPVD